MKLFYHVLLEINLNETKRGKIIGSLYVTVVQNVELSISLFYVLLFSINAKITLGMLNCLF